METSTNINESLDLYDRDSLMLEKRKTTFIEYITDIENGKYLMPEENSFNEWTVWFNDEMIIFNITDDAKDFFKEHIKNNDFTQWMVYKNIMAIFNITQTMQETFITYISIHESKYEENKELKDKKTKLNVQYYEHLNIHPINIKTPRPDLLENYNYNLTI